VIQPEARSQTSEDVKVVGLLVVQRGEDADAIPSRTRPRACTCWSGGASLAGGMAMGRQKQRLSSAVSRVGQQLTPRSARSVPISWKEPKKACTTGELDTTGTLAHPGYSGGLGPILPQAGLLRIRAKRPGAPAPDGTVRLAAVVAAHTWFPQKHATLALPAYGACWP